MFRAGAPGDLWLNRGDVDYNFFIDFMGHQTDARVKSILKQTAEKTAFLKILGSYPRAELPDL